MRFSSPPLGLEKINATHGRKIGNTILQKFATSLKELVRKGERLSVGVATLVPQNGQKSDQDALYRRSLEALDKAKMQGNHIEIISES